MNSTKTETVSNVVKGVAEKFVPQPMKRMDRAMMTLSKAGIPIPVKRESVASAAGLAKDLLIFGSSEVNAIVRVMSDIQTFNEVVRENLGQETSGERYVNIAKDMNSIREDANRMISQLDDGRLSIKDRLQNSWMSVRRGSIPKRFERVRDNATMIHTSSGDTMARMTAVLQGYSEARGAVQEARTLSDIIRERARNHVEAKQQELQAVNNSVESAEADPTFPSVELNQLLLKRDDKVNEVKDADRLFQIAEDIYNNLTVAYTAGDQVMERIRQTNEVHERIYSQSVIFFTTNEIVLTALSASHIQKRSLHEATQGHKALKDSMNEAIADLGVSGNKLLEEGIREGYGPTLTADSLRKLTESIEKFQEESTRIRDEMRIKATENSREMEALSEASRKRMAQLIVEQNLPERERPLARPQLAHESNSTKE